MRNQSQDLKNKRLTWIIVVLLILIVVLLFTLLVGSFYRKETDTKPSFSTESKESYNTSSSSYLLSSTTETSSSSEIMEYPYTVNLQSNSVYQGEYKDLWFDMVTYENNDNVAVSYEMNSTSESTVSVRQTAVLVPIQIKTKVIDVQEGNRQKQVKVNTELKLSTSGNGDTTPHFFEPFNGNDTKVYAYYKNNGNIALAFSPKNADFYQVILYQEIEFLLK